MPSKEVAMIGVPNTATNIVDGDLKDMLTKLNEALQTVQEDQENYSAGRILWVERMHIATGMMALALSADALKASTVLFEQAEKFYNHFHENTLQSKRKATSIKTHIEKIENMITVLKAAEKNRILNNRLTRLTSGSAAELVSSEDQKREVERLIHTAQALIELKSESVTI